MGALTDNRKRCFADLRLSSPPPPPPPSSKKQKNPNPSDPDSTIPTIPTVPIGAFPPPAPLRRAIQGPQRTIRVFGLGLPGARPARETMGNLLARAVRRVPKRELELEKYKRLVEEVRVEEEEGTSAARSRQFVVPVPVPDLRAVVVVAEGSGERRNVVNRKVEEERVVTVDLTPGREEVRWTVPTKPVYKSLLEEAGRKYDAKISNLDFEVKLAEQEVARCRSFRKVKAEDEEDLEGPFIPLTQEDENIVNLALRNPSRKLRGNDILVMHDASNIEITRERMLCLQHGAWLNDEVINLYLELLKEREKREPKKFLNCHFFNTFFYKKLTGGKDCYDYKAVRRWTTQRKIGYNLIDCDKIFVPIHKEIHWCLAVISVKEEKIQYLDSLGVLDREVLSVLARYLTDEALDKSHREIDVSSWEHERVHGLPLQKNGWDCGMFMLKYIDFYSRGLGLRFGQENMNYFRKRTVKELLRLRAE